MPDLSVIICAHNPRLEYLERTLQGLRAQTLPLDQWELLLIDNLSSPALAERIDLSWHPAGRIICEEKLGLTAARLRGFAEARSSLFVCVDDDNVLAADYLEKAREIDRAMPFLGAWGGQQIPEFETQPDPCVKPHLCMLALNSFKGDHWSNYSQGNQSIPSGAGMCVRAAVADKYLQETQESPLRRSLDRKGQSLMSHGDYDLAMTACDLGLGLGTFARLMLVHLIPAARVQPDYFLRMAESMAYSNILFESIRPPPPSRPPFLGSIRRWVSMMRLPPFERQMRQAGWRGEKRARKVSQKVKGA